MASSMISCGLFAAAAPWIVGIPVDIPKSNVDVLRIMAKMLDPR